MNQRSYLQATISEALNYLPVDSMDTSSKT